MHNIVENNLQKHGAYKAFGNDPRAINELRSSVANMAIYSLGDPKFGQMNDPMATYEAQQKQSRDNIDYAPTDFDDDPEITDSDKYNKIKSEFDSLKFDKYKPSSSYNSSKAQIDKYEKDLANYLKLPVDAKTGLRGGNYAPEIPKDYAGYKNALAIEGAAKKAGVAKIGDIKKHYEESLENMRKMSKTMWVDDNKDVAKKHYLQNIISNKSQSQKFEEEIGMSPQEVINDPKKLELLRFGINPRKGLFAQYSESPTKHKKSTLDYGISGNAYSSTDSRINAAYSNAYEGKLSGNDLLGTGHFKKVNRGYETTTMSDRNNRPIFISESDVKSGLDNETVRTLFDNILNKVYWNNSSYARASVDASPTKVGGGK